jgi:hypothetical protein
MKNIVTGSLIQFILMMDAIPSSEMSVITRATRRHLTEEGIPNLFIRQSAEPLKIEYYLLAKHVCILNGSNENF